MKYLIKDTTKEERLQYVQKALLISMSDADKPSNKVMMLIQEYIDGKKELDEIKEEIIKEYQKHE